MSDEWSGLPSLDLPAIAELAKYPNWVCWRLIERNGKMTKVPLDPKTGKFANVTNPRTWAGFAQAYEVAEQNIEISGVGFVFTAKLPYTFIDLDKCHDPSTGKVEPWAEKYIKMLGSYTEISPSGTGFHVFVRGKPAHDRRRIGSLEVYPDKRFSTVTGEHFSGTPNSISEAAEAIEEILSTAFQQSAAVTGRKGKDDEILGQRNADTLAAEIAGACHPDAEPSFEAFDVLCSNSAIVRQTFEHTRRDAREWSLSEYDLALANFFLSAKWSNEEITRGLIAHRRRWGGDKLDRPDYYARTILTAHTNRGRQDAQADISEAALEGKDQQKLEQVTLKSLSEIYGVEFTAIKKFIADPPRYEVRTALGVIGPGEIDLLFSQTNFRKAAASSLNMMFPKCKEKEWEERVKAMLLICDEDSLGPDATYGGQMATWLRDYITEIAGEIREKDDEALRAKAPFMWQHRIAIAGGGFAEYLQRSKGQRISRQVFGFMLRRTGAEPERFSYLTTKGKRSSLNCWLLPKGFEDESDREEF